MAVAPFPGCCAARRLSRRVALLSRGRNEGSVLVTVPALRCTVEETLHRVRDTMFNVHSSTNVTVSGTLAREVR